jgi:phenylacetate-CoA ligase
MHALRSSLPGIAWPAVPGGESARLLGLLFQLERSQWLAPEALARLQFTQLARSVAHAVETVPFYRESLSAHRLAADPEGLREAWPALPVLPRSALQAAGETIHSQAVPREHGRVTTVQTSGSTGRPIRTLNTALNQIFWQALTLREHLWHARDPLGKLVAIRPDRKAPAGEGKVLASWGPPVAVLFRTGPSALLDSRTDIEAQVRWLAAQQPSYLLSLPSNVQALAEACRDMGVELPQLRGVRVYGEAVGPELRRLSQEVWGVPLSDMYSAQEVGYIALQCPRGEHYHVQSEHLLVEVLDEQGRPCGPGEVGRVLISTLHNLATPLIRYEIMDYVEVGEACPCGRGLPVIRRVLGRQRNLAVTPDGRRYWPSFPAEDWMHLAPVRQVQLAQTAPDHIEVRYVMARALTREEEGALTCALHASLGHPYALSFRRWEDPIIRAPNGKYEDFVCEIGA